MYLSLVSLNLYFEIQFEKRAKSFVKNISTVSLISLKFIFDLRLNLIKNKISNRYMNYEVIS